MVSKMRTALMLVACVFALFAPFATASTRALMQVEIVPNPDPYSGGPGNPDGDGLIPVGGRRALMQGKNELEEMLLVHPYANHGYSGSSWKSTNDVRRSALGDTP